MTTSRETFTRGIPVSLPQWLGQVRHFWAIQSVECDECRYRKPAGCALLMDRPAGSRCPGVDDVPTVRVQ